MRRSEIGAGKYALTTYKEDGTASVNLQYPRIEASAGPPSGSATLLGLLGDDPVASAGAHHDAAALAGVAVAHRQAARRAVCSSTSRSTSVLDRAARW